MAEIHKSATIDVPAERAFDIVEDPVNTPKFVPNVTDVADINRSDARVGDSFRVIYKVIGVTFDEKFKVVEYQRPNLIKLAFEGGMSGTFNWTFAGGTGGTKVTIDVDYQLAGGPLGKAVDALMLHRTNEKTIEETLTNLGRVAAQAPAAT